MTNGQIYSKTIGFSIRRLLFDILAFVIMIGVAAAGYFIGDKAANQALIGLGIGVVAGLIFLAVFLRYVSYTYKAGQIAMMTEAITKGELPSDVIGAGKKVVKERFLTVAAYFAATSVIKGIFSQLGRAISSIGENIGGDTGNAVGSVISGVIQTIVAYLCDCCLGWVFFRKAESAGRATCEGAVLFFKHGKTFAKNMGRVFGMGIASFAVIGGAFMGVFYLIARRFTPFFTTAAAELSNALTDESSWIANLLKKPETLMLVAAFVGAVIIWSILHEAFVRPYVLTGVLRNYLQSGMEDIPDESSFAMLDSKSKKFAKLHKGLS